MDQHLIVGVVVAFAAALVAIRLLKPLAPRLGLVDEPGGRKKHGGAVPLVGGLAVVAGFVGGIGAGGGLAAVSPALVVAVLGLLALGTVDDALALRGVTKLFWQFAMAALAVLGGGAVISHLGMLPGIGALDLPPLVAAPLTIFALVGLINAVNMLDGLDGLAGGVSAAMLAWLLLLAGLQGQSTHQLLTAVLLAALVAFLFFNGRLPWRRQAEVFLGDAGSMCLGLVVGWCVIQGSQAQTAVVSPVVYLWIVALPVMDTLSLTVRRVLRGRHPFVADRDHIHHLFLRAGFTPGEASYCLVGISFVVGGMGVLAGFAGVPDWLLAVSLAGLMILHYVFVRYAWRTMKALGRLNRLYHRLEYRKSCRGALAGLYVLVFFAPLSATLALVGLAGVFLATLGVWRTFLAELRRTPVAWLSLAVAGYVVARGAVGGTDIEALGSQLLPLTGVLSVPVGWWLARLWLHWRWLLASLIAGVGVSFVADARWDQLRAGGLEHPLAWGADAQTGIGQVVVLVMLLAVILAAAQRLGRGWRPRFALLVSLGLAVPLVIILIGSFYATAWVGALAGIVVLGAGAAFFAYGRREWCGLVGGVALVLLVAGGTWQVVASHQRIGDALTEPVRAAMLHLGGEPEAAAAVHATTSDRLAQLALAAEHMAERPWFGHGKLTVGAARPSSGSISPYSGLVGMVAVAFGGVGLLLFAALFVGLTHMTLTAGRSQPSSATWSLGIVAAFFATITMLALDVHVDQPANRFMVMLLMAAGYAMAFGATGSLTTRSAMYRRIGLGYRPLAPVNDEIAQPASSAGESPERLAQGRGD